MAKSTRVVGYPDANFWIAPYDEAGQWPNEVLDAVNQIIAWHHNGKVELVTSFGVERDIERAKGIPAKTEKAQKGQELLESLGLRHLTYSAGYYGDPVKGRFGFARYGTAEVFQKSNLKDSQDRDALDFIPRNRVAYFITLDNELRGRRRIEIEEGLKVEKTKVVTPQEFLRSLS